MLQALNDHPSLILGVDSYLHRRHGDIEQYKAVIILVDGTRLHLNEVWVRGQLRKYAYYHLGPTGQILHGWDNAPHHPEIPTYPHHCHCGDGIEPSDVRSLADALERLETFISK